MNQRTNERPVRIEQRDNGQKVLVGYAAVFYDPADPGTEYRMSTKVVERVGRTAFARSTGENRDVICAVNHDRSQLLGRTSSGTMRLIVDDVGLRYEADLPDTQVGRDTETMVTRGDYPGSSFRFRDAKSKWQDGPDQSVRELVDLDLVDVGPVTEPAYKSATAGMRSEDVEAALQELADERRIESDRVQVALAMKRH